MSEVEQINIPTASRDKFNQLKKKNKRNFSKNKHHYYINLIFKISTQIQIYSFLDFVLACLFTGCQKCMFRWSIQ